MDESEVRSAVDALSAYDLGAVQSGVRDEALRARVITHVRALSAEDRRALMARVLRDLCLTDVAIAQGYGAEDAASLIRWMDDNGILV